MKCVQQPTPIQTHFNGSWDEVGPNHTCRAAPSFSMINSLEFDESWSRSQFYWHTYPIHNKEQKHMHDENSIFETSSLIHMKLRKVVAWSYKFHTEFQVNYSLQWKDWRMIFYSCLYAYGYNFLAASYQDVWYIYIWFICDENKPFIVINIVLCFDFLACMYICCFVIVSSKEKITNHTINIFWNINFCRLCKIILILISLKEQTRT
jgi:hypothetical protein